MALQNEWNLIERIRRVLPSRGGGEVRLGIGDDAAVIRPQRGREIVISTDQFIEGRHFVARRHPADAVGFKALTRATSDLAAMGAEPRYFFLTMALPANRTGEWLDEFLRGMARAARAFGMAVLGGDLARLETVAISITVLGKVRAGEAMTRSGAQAGDAIFVSGVLGRAALGLRLFLEGGRRAAEQAASASGTAADAIRAHLFPQPRLALGQWLARQRVASSMIDISDGFSTDLHHVCAASGLGARIRIGRLPTTPIPAQARRLRLDSFELGLHGGDDYELLFTIPARLVSKIPARFGKLALTRVGEMTRDRKILLVDSRGKSRPLVPRGWQHF